MTSPAQSDRKPSAVDSDDADQALSSRSLSERPGHRSESAVRDLVDSSDRPGAAIDSPVMKSHRSVTRGQNQTARLSTVITSACGPHDLIVAPRFVGLNGTDIQAFRGAQRALADTPGHEGVGVVAEVGGLVEEWSQGDPVVFNPASPSNPGEVLGHTFDGLLQEKILIADVQSTNWLIQSIPGEMVSPLGALIQPVATAIYSQELVNRSSSEHVAVVVGDGPMALIHSAVLRHSGFSTVLMVHGRSPRYKWAVANGYFDDEDVILGRGNVAEQVNERLGGALANAVIVCTPGEAVEQAVNDAVAYLGPGGTIDIVSDTAPPVVSLERSDLNIAAIRRKNWCGQPSPGYFERIETTDGESPRVTSHSGTSASHIRASVELLVDAPGDFDALVADVVDLAEGPSLISSVVARSFGKHLGGGAEGGDRPMKAVIELNRGEF